MPNAPHKKSRKRISVPRNSGIRTRRKRPLLCEMDLTENSLKRAEAANQDGTLGKLDDLICQCYARLRAELTLRGLKPVPHFPAPRRRSYATGKDKPKGPPR